jgi:hypothetical protein
MRKNIAIAMLFNILFIFLTLFLFVYTNIFFLFLIFPFIPLIFFKSFGIKLLRNENDNNLEKQLVIKQEIMDDIYQTINYTKRRYKSDLINKNIMLLRDLEKLKKQIDKARIDENCKRELRDYLDKQIA